MKDGTIRIGLNTGGGVATFAGVKAWCAVLATSSVLVEQLEKVYAPLIDGIMYLSALLESH
uniref:C-terminal zinc-finger n=1 Tax=Solanum tuberosum TaxID=4113 RepID=M1B2F7_SOLTU